MYVLLTETLVVVTSASVVVAGASSVEVINEVDGSAAVVEAGAAVVDASVVDGASEASGLGYSEYIG